MNKKRVRVITLMQEAAARRSWLWCKMQVPGKQKLTMITMIMLLL